MAECNCGWGGVHDPDNQKCEANKLSAPEVTITRLEYTQLLKDRMLLIELEANGVDNWIAYDGAFEAYNEALEREGLK